MAVPTTITHKPSDNPNDRYAVSASTGKKVLLRKARNKAVITGGDRADIQLAALETSTKCIVLTGDLYPNAIILARAQECGVPIVETSHEVSENPGLHRLTDMLAAAFPDVDFHFFENRCAWEVQ